MWQGHPSAVIPFQQLKSDRKESKFYGIKKRKHWGSVWLTGVWLRWDFWKQGKVLSGSLGILDSLDWLWGVKWAVRGISKQGALFCVGAEGFLWPAISWNSWGSWGAFLGQWSSCELAVMHLFFPSQHCKEESYLHLMFGHWRQAIFGPLSWIQVFASHSEIYLFMRA